MAKCEYILERDLPSVATADELAHVQNACSQRSLVGFGFSAKYWLADSAVPEYQLRGAIIRHIKAGKRTFHKFKDDGSKKLIERDIQANVTISEGHNIYVEIALEDDSMIQIYVHEHKSGKLLLPQT